jgi:hypothetical protein
MTEQKLVTNHGHVFERNPPEIERLPFQARHIHALLMTACLVLQQARDAAKNGSLDRVFIEEIVALTAMLQAARLDYLRRNQRRCRA